MSYLLGMIRAHPDLNQGPADLQSAALATELCTLLSINNPQLEPYVSAKQPPAYISSCAMNAIGVISASIPRASTQLTRYLAHRSHAKERPHNREFYAMSRTRAGGETPCLTRRALESVAKVSRKPRLCRDCGSTPSGAL